MRAREAASGARAAAALRAEARRRRLQRRRLHRARGSRSIRRRSSHDPSWAFGEWLLAERYIPGRELTCAVMGDRVLGVTEIVPAETLRFYNYEAKYAAGGSRPPAAGADFIECLRIGAEVNVDGS